MANSATKTAAAHKSEFVFKGQPCSPHTIATMPLKIPKDIDKHIPHGSIKYCTYDQIKLKCTQNNPLVIFSMVDSVYFRIIVSVEGCAEHTYKTLFLAKVMNEQMLNQTTQVLSHKSSLQWTQGTQE